MDKNQLIIQNLEIRKMPGFERGMKRYSDFSPQINIIAGPNASGKSTTARAIQKLIWQRNTARMNLEGDLRVNGEPWGVRIDSNFKQVQRSGIDDELRGLPAAESSDRYMLALHELILDEGGDLAQKIIRESIGGVDLDKAAADRNYSSSVKTTGIGEYKAYKRATNTVLEQNRIQRDLKKESLELVILQEKKEEAEQAALKKELYQDLINYLKAEEVFGRANALLEEFPEVMENVRGDEAERVESLEKEMLSAKRSISNSKENLESLQTDLEKLDLPKEGIPATEIDELELRTEAIKELERGLSEQKEKRDALDSRKTKILDSIGKDINTDDWDGLNLDEIGSLDQFLQDAHTTASRSNYWSTVLIELENQLLEPVADRETLNQAVKHLSLWLKETEENKGLPGWILISIALASGLTALVSYFWWPGSLIGAAIVLTIALYGILAGRSSNRSHRTELREEDFKNTGLTAPEEWNPETVQQRLDELLESLKEAHSQERIRQEKESAEKKLRELSGNISELKDSRERLKDRLKALPELPFDDPENDNKLYWFLVRVLEWHEADDEQQDVDASLKDLRERYDEQLRRANAIIRPYRAANITDYATAHAQVKELKRLEDQRQKAFGQIEIEQKAISTASQSLETRQEEQNKIFQRLGTEPEDRNRVLELSRGLEEYQKAKNEFGFAEKDLQQKERKLKADPLFEKLQIKPELIALDEAELLRNQFEKQASGLDDIQDKMSRIDERVKEAKRGHSLEDKLRAKDEALENLQVKYEQNLESLTGNLIVNRLREEMRESNRPKVFKRANRLFNRITKGQYEIGIDESDDATFVAYDTVKNEGLELDQLSSGTRIQLLLSVRLAFVEMQEPALKLPILADELLANSDDQRARAIIEALIEISREGRQVFYFTAQADEVGKWKSVMENWDGVDLKEFYISDEDFEGSDPLFKVNSKPFDLMRKVPQPDGMGHDSYGEKLKRPVFNLTVHEPESLHLWYLIEDPELLSECLKLGVDRWGKLNSFLNHGGVIDDLSKDNVEEMRKKIDLLGRYQQLYRRGRSQPIKRHALEDSGAVSPTFIDSVSAKLTEVSGDPGALLEALNNSEVSGFRSSKTDELEEYLINNGYIDTREPLTQEEIEIQLQAYLSNLELTREEAERFLKRVNEN